MKTLTQRLWSDSADLPLRRAWWRLLHALCFVWFRLCYGFRAVGVTQVPRRETGPLLILANHQSFFDPIIVGLGVWRRPFHAMARSTLFTGPLGWLIRSLNAIPVELESKGDMSAMRACLAALEQGHALMLFPEGTRTPDGVTHDFDRGLMLMIKRAKPLVLPVAIEGAFHAWPRSRKAPRLTSRIMVKYGEPIPAETLLAMKTDDALRHLRDTVEGMRVELAARMAVAAGSRQ